VQLSGLHTLGASVRHTIGAPNTATRPWLAPRQWAGLALLGILITAIFLTGPIATIFLVVAATAYLVVSTLDSSYLALRRHPEEAPASPDDFTYAVPDDQLPRYTVVITALVENVDISTVLRQAARRIQDIDYPLDKLDARLVITEDIVNPAEVLLENGIRLIILPSSRPHTPADVCNYVLNSAIPVGEYITLYQLNDVPDRLQLRHAIQTFATAPTNVAALQAKLRYINVEPKLSSHLRAIEYERWFSNRAPILSRLGCVMPLTTTSHHIRTSLLHDIGGWDPTQPRANVDLSIRFARNGYRVLILDSYTNEMAVPNSARSDNAWYEGYLRVIAAYAKQPIRLSRELGLSSVVRIFDVTAGRPAAYLANVVLWALLITQLTGVSGFYVSAWVVQATALFCLLAFLATNFVAALTKLKTARAPAKN